MVFGNVVLRYGFNSGIDISDELSRYCFIWLTYIGAMQRILDFAAGIRFSRELQARETCV